MDARGRMGIGDSWGMGLEGMGRGLGVGGVSEFVGERVGRGDGHRGRVDEVGGVDRDMGGVRGIGGRDVGTERGRGA